MKNVFRSFVLTLVLLGCFVQSSQAYFTTNQRSVTGTGTAGLFLVEYRFGHSKYDLYLPVMATANQDKKSNAVSFQIHGTDDITLTGKTNAIVLSNARVENGMYVVPKGTVANFTLVMFYTPDPTLPAASYYASVTHLPFSFNNTQQLALNPSELKAYQTKSVTLGSR